MDYDFSEIMTAEQAAEAAKGLTFEKVWAALMESRVKSESILAKMESNMQKSKEEMDKTLKELSKNLGGLGNRVGDITQALFSSELWKLFSEYGYELTQQVSNAKYVVNGAVVAEADYRLENGTYVMLVEVKTKTVNRDIDEHLERIGTVRQYMDARKDGRKLVGAVAGAVVADGVMNYAHANGLYILKLAGEDVVIAGAPPGFCAREW